MDLISDLIASVLTAAFALVSPQATPLERQIERTYEVPAGATVSASLSGGRILVVPGQGRTVTVTLIQRVYTANERDAETALKDYTVDLGQQAGDVRVVARRTGGPGMGLWRPIRVSISAELAVPPDVVLDLRTSGGSIEVRGTRTARVGARTSGGSITVDAAHAPIEADTSGGSIRIGLVADSLRAHTSGGSIRIGDVTAAAAAVDAQTSGGSIRVGINPDARLAVDASTSGGSVSVDGLSLSTSRRTRTRVTGTLNGGGGRLRAHTSGGSVRLSAS